MLRYDKTKALHACPPCWCIYMLGLTLEWLESQGGVPGMERIKNGKAQMLYDTLDNSKLLHGCCRHRGWLPQPEGHRKVGGMCVSIYNAMRVEGMEKLCDFIRKFDREH